MIPRFMYPEALLLGIPALGLVWVLHSRGRAGLRGLRGRIALTIRSAIVILLLLALAGLQMVEERRFATVIFAVDCSRSVPEALQKRSLEYIRGALKTKMPDDRAGLIAFGGHASVERWPDESFVTTPETIRGQIRKDATDISEALRAAAAAFPSAGGKRVVLFTDGRETRGDAAAEAQRLRAAGIRIDVVPLDSGWTREVLVEKLAMPAEVGFDEAFDADVHVRSTGPCDAVVRLFSDERMEPPERDSAGRLAPEAADGRGTDAGGEEGGKHRPAKTMLLERRVRLLEGRNRIPFPGLRIRRGGFHRFEATVETLDPGADSIMENNHAYGFTHVETDCRALIMTSDIGMIEPLYAALEGERLELDVRTPINLPTSPAEIADYDCIVLANIGRGHFSGPMMEEIEVCVRDRGAGLIMIGGDQSFGAGGYLNTPVESALPVKMDIENRKLMPNGALALVIDRSGSMEGDKLALAKAAARAAADTLSDEDYIAVLAFDAEVYWLVRPIRAQHRGKIRAAISSLGAGGGTFIYPALKEAWYALKPLDAATKHIILLSDGQTMGNGYEKLARAIAADRITVTSVGIGEPDGQPLMQSIARNGGGRYYEAKDPRKLPQIFIKEAAIVRKPLILSDEKGLPVQPHQPGELARGMASPIPPVRAIVMTTPKPAAEIELVVTAGGEKLPLLAAWHFGLGRAVAFTSDASARWAPAWVSWEGYKGFWIRTFRWAGRKRIPGEHTVTCRAEGEIARVTIEGIDRKGEYINFARLAGAATGPSREPVPLRFEQKAPGRYEAIFALDEVGAYSVTVVDERPGGIAHSQTVGISNSYSPEYLHLDADRPLIARLASSDPAAGRMLSLDDDPGKAGIFARDFPPSREPTDMFWLLLWAALLLFPLDVAVRRVFFEP
ncbi:MAG: VWA domain-containing protein, partial [Planctomycetota bacterium]|nr:VWA domain-containing protein [Planctomycetota bacterium]